jgi:glucose-6-phosphate-specific signal transduction histidine kinase
VALDAATLATGAALGTPLLGAHLALTALLCCLAWGHADAIALRPDELAGRMTRARESEREHLNRELHDDIGQLLTAARLQLEWLGRRGPARAIGGDAA